MGVPVRQGEGQRKGAISRDGTARADHKGVFCMEKQKEEDLGLRVYQTAFVLYTASTYLQNTMYNEFALMARLFVFGRYISFLLLGALIGLRILGEWQRLAGRLSRRQTAPERTGGFRWILCLLVFAVSLAVSLKTKDRTTLYAAALLFAARERYVRKTLRVIFYEQIILMCLVVGGSTVGLLPDLLIKRDAIPIRHSLGYTYPSVFTGYLFFLLLLYLWLYEKRMRPQDLVWLEVINCLVFLLTDTRIFFLLANVLLLLAYLGCCRGLAASAQGQELQRRLRDPEGIWGLLYDFFPGIVCAGYFLLCLAHALLGGESPLDSLLSGRLSLTVSAIREYGVHLIPDSIVWVGFGGATDTDRLLRSYNFVDCSYAYILISYGLLIFLLVMAYLVLMQRTMRQRLGLWKCVLLLFIWVFCMVEPRLLELQANCFLLLGVSLFYRRPPAQESLAADGRRTRDGASPGRKRRDR